MIAYRLLVWLLRAATHAFFRHVEVVGRHHIPEEGGVVFCGNHPNSLLDPVLITAHAGRVVHFAAKDALFKSPFLRGFLRTLGAVPVMRKRDHEGPIDNDGMFSAMFKVLLDGRAVGIFPEGISHDQSQLAPLKTGAARIALGARLRGARVCVVPTGLCYTTRDRFRSSVLIQFGEPIWLEPEDRDSEGLAPSANISADERHRHKVDALTDEIEVHLRALTINANDWNTIRVLDAVRRLYQPPELSYEERVELSRRFNRLYPAVASKPDVAAAYLRVSLYLMRLEAVGLDDTTLRRNLSATNLAARSIGHASLLVFWLPLALLAAPLHVPVLLAVKLAGRYLSPRPDTVATTKFVLGFFVVLLVYATLITLGANYRGLWTALALGLALPLSGLALLKVLGRFRRFRILLMAAWRSFRLRIELVQLRIEREELRALILDLVARYRDPGVEAFVTSRSADDS